MSVLSGPAGADPQFAKARFRVMATAGVAVEAMHDVYAASPGYANGLGTGDLYQSVLGIDEKTFHRRVGDMAKASCSPAIS